MKYSEYTKQVIELGNAWSASNLEVSEEERKPNIKVEIKGFVGSLLSLIQWHSSMLPYKCARYSINLFNETRILSYESLRGNLPILLSQPCQTIRKYNHKFV